MLEYLRKKAQSPYLQATVLILVVVFVFWGTKFGGNGGAAAGCNGVVSNVAIRQPLARATGRGTPTLPSSHRLTADRLTPMAFARSLCVR